jgi:glutaredoxin 3
MANIIIYTKSMCPYCTKAKALLNSKKAKFTEIDITGKDDLRSEMITKANGRTSVPQIFINGEHIGGCDDLHACNDAGKLDKKLRA